MKNRNIPITGALSRDGSKTKTFTFTLDLPAWIVGELARASVNLDCTPEEAFVRFIQEDDEWSEALIAWGQMLES